MNATVALRSGLRSEGRYFYLWMAGGFLLVAFGGFSPTYWSPMAAGTFHAPPIIHIHGMLMFIWTCFFFIQTALVSTGRTLDHRAWGLAGIALFSVLAYSILIGEMAVLKRDDGLGMGEGARRFAAVTLCAWPLMVTFFTLAIVNIRHPEVHKRLMLLLMIAMMTPALARLFLTFLAPPGAVGPPPAVVSVPPALAADVFLLVAMIYDWRTRGRPHRVYVIGGAALMTQQLLTVPFAATGTWLRIVQVFESLAG